MHWHDGELPLVAAPTVAVARPLELGYWCGGCCACRCCTPATAAGRVMQRRMQTILALQPGLMMNFPPTVPAFTAVR